jgi:hypothetical protein
MSPHFIHRVAVAVAVGCALASSTVGFVHAQIPEKFKNLKVLPRDISRPALVQQMREVAGALGVRCGFCHSGGNPETLEGVNFASDSLETKRVARVMMRMTREINSSLLPQTGRDTTRLARVSCVTCHHGARRPETLADTLQRALQAGGAPAAIGAYRALRDQYYGRAVYDFGEGTLQWVSELAARRPEQLDASIALLELNLEFFPKSVNTRVALGDRMVAKGDTAEAVKQWQDALELQPDNHFVQGKLEAVRGVKR